MRWILIFAIKAYRLIPARFKRRCLFKETCSLYTMRIAREQGFISAIKAMSWRFKVCRPKYAMFYDSEKYHWEMETLDGTRVPASEIAEFVIEPYENVLNKVISQ